MLKTLFVLFCITLVQTLRPAAPDESSEDAPEISYSQHTIQDFWLMKELHDSKWGTPEDRRALVWAIRKYTSKGYSHFGASINEVISHFQKKPRAEFEERVLAPFKRAGEFATAQATAILTLSEKDTQKIIAQKVAALYRFSSAEAQARHTAEYLGKLKSTAPSKLAWETERILEKIEGDFEKRQKHLARDIKRKYRDIDEAQQRALTHFLAPHSLDISTVSEASALLERALLDPHSNAEYRRTTAEQLRAAAEELGTTADQLTQTREQRDAAQQQATVLAELLRQAQEAQAAAEHRSTADVERESASRQSILQELVAKEAAAVREKEALAAELAQEKKVGAEAHAKSEEDLQAAREVERLAAETIDDLKDEIKALTKRIDALPDSECSDMSTQTDPPQDETPPTPQQSWIVAPLNEWKMPDNTVWFPWLFALSFYGSDFVDVDDWISDCANHLELPQVRDFFQKRIIPQKVLENKNVRRATNAVLTAIMLKVAHLIMQQCGGGKLINSEGENPNRLSPNFNTLIHLAGISYLLWKCNDALLTPKEQENDDDY